MAQVLFHSDTNETFVRAIYEDKNGIFGVAKYVIHDIQIDEKTDGTRVDFIGTLVGDDGIVIEDKRTAGFVANGCNESWNAERAISRLRGQYTYYAELLHLTL